MTLSAKRQKTLAVKSPVLDVKRIINEPTAAAISLRFR